MFRRSFRKPRPHSFRYRISKFVSRTRSILLDYLVTQRGKVDEEGAALSTRGYIEMIASVAEAAMNVSVYVRRQRSSPGSHRPARG